MVTVVFFLSVGNLKAQAVEDDELFKPVEIKDGITLSILDCVASAFKNSPKSDAKNIILILQKLT